MSMDDRADTVARERQYRRQVLEAFYDKWHATDSTRARPWLSAQDVAALLGVDFRTAFRVVDHLREKGLVEQVLDQYVYAITVTGRETIEDPAHLDVILPLPVVQNVVHVEGDLSVAGPLQQGLTNVAEQRITWSEVERLAAQTRELVVTETTVCPSAKDALADLDALIAEAGKAKPDVGVARGLLAAVWRGVQGLATLRSVYPLLQALATSLGCSLPAFP